MPEPPEERLLLRAGAAAAARPAFLAWTLARFRSAERLDDDGLARWLGIDPGQVRWLGLCRRPRPERFAADTRAIAERFGVEPSRLAALIRQVEALDALGGAVDQDAGVLAAARDREDGAEAPPEDDGR